MTERSAAGGPPSPGDGADRPPDADRAAHGRSMRRRAGAAGRDRERGPAAPALRTARRLPAWFGSIRVRLAFVYSSVLFSVATFIVGVLYMAETWALASMRERYPSASPMLYRDEYGNTIQYLTPSDFAFEVHGEALEVLRQYSLWAIVVLFLLSLVIGWAVSGGVLRPIERITGVAKDIQATDLSRRINLGGPHDELRELADTFDAMLGRIDDAFESQRQFIHEASHELRNPLAVIRTNLDVVLSDPGAEVDDLRHTLEVVARSSERMGRLVDDLLVYARNGSLSLQREVVDVATLVHETAEEFAVPADARGLALVAHAGPGLVVEGDRHALRQALANLLANAVRLAPAGTTVRVRAGAQGPWVWMSVEDEGPGIAPEDQDRVFQRFWRGESRTTGRRGRGEVRSGLGLTIVRQVAQAHGGEVKLVSAVGRGSAFAVWLPAATVSRRPGEGPSAPSSPPTGEHPAATAGPGRSDRSDRSDHSDQPERSGRSEGRGDPPGAGDGEVGDAASSPERGPAPSGAVGGP